MILQEGAKHVMQLMTQEQSVPAEYYIGWATNLLSSVLYTATLASLTELTGNGYARQRVYPGNAYAEGTLTMESQPADGDTITFDTTTYRFKNTMAVAEDVKIGATLADTQDHLRKTINGTGTAGVDYYTGSTSPHATVEMDAWASDDAIVRALVAGTGGNSIVTTETFSSGALNYFDAATLGTTRAGGWELSSAAGGVNGWAVTTHQVTFSASGGDWLQALTKFFTTVQSGTSGELIAIEELNGGSGVTLLDGTNYDNAMSVLGYPET
jgi:hypothetical protein